MSSIGSQCLSEKLRDDYNIKEEELEKSTTSAIEELEVSIDWEEGVPEEPDSDSDRADSDCEGVSEEQNINTDVSDTDSEGVCEELGSDIDNADPEYTPGMCEEQASVRQKRLSSAGVKKEEDLGLPQPEHSSSHEQTQERRPEAPKQYEGHPRLKKKHDCLTCGRVFSNSTGLRRHLVIHSGQRPFKCFICGKGFTQGGNLKTHMKVHKGGEQQWKLLKEETAAKESPITAHVCGQCGMDFPQKEQLEEHSNSHRKPYECPYCGKTFKNEDYFELHKQVHSGESPFICSECGRSFVTSSLLKTHKYTHTGEKNFHCKQCGKAFSRPSYLKVHLRTHTGERPHLCSVCGKSYSRKDILKVHLQVHTGEKPFVCEKCGKSFVYHQGYRLHMRVHNKKEKNSN